MVYLIHFARPYFHAQHYIGSSDDLGIRAERHLNGQGSPLLRAVSDNDIKWAIIRHWPGGRAFERQLKNRKDARALCPICNPKSWFMNATEGESTHEQET